MGCTNIEAYHLPSVLQACYDKVAELKEETEDKRQLRNKNESRSPEPPKSDPHPPPPPPKKKTRRSQRSKRRASLRSVANWRQLGEQSQKGWVWVWWVFFCRNFSSKSGCSLLAFRRGPRLGLQDMMEALELQSFVPLFFSRARPKP